MEKRPQAESPKHTIYIIELKQQITFLRHGCRFYGFHSPMPQVKLFRTFLGRQGARSPAHKQNRVTINSQGWVNSTEKPGPRDSVPLTDANRLKNEFVEKAMPSGNIYSFTLPSGERSVLEVLRVNKKADKKVVTSKKTDVGPSFTLTVQQYSQWRPGQDRFMVYPLGDPARISPSDISTLGNISKAL